jgi:hypothetical protein
MFTMLIEFVWNTLEKLPGSWPDSFDHSRTDFEYGDDKAWLSWFSIQFFNQYSGRLSFLTDINLPTVLLLSDRLQKSTVLVPWKLK